nr:myb-like domain, Myb/SANT-like DNA-binding domain protein [Tanacetum cinerariifolium]
MNPVTLPIFSTPTRNNTHLLRTNRIRLPQNRDEEILLAESWIEHPEDVNIGKDQNEDVYWNLIMEDFNSRTESEPRTKNMMTENGRGCTVIAKDNLQELFGPDPIERPADKQRPKKKQKSVETISVGGSIGGRQSESVSSLVSQDYRRKCDVAEEAYKAKKEKELGMLQCRELEFLMIDHSSLPPAKRAIVEMKQAEIIRKYPNAAP